MHRNELSLKALLRPEEKSAAYRKLELCLTRAPHVQLHRSVRIHGYQATYKVYWHTAEEVAFCFNECAAHLRHHPYWVGIGLQNPASAKGEPLDTLPTQFNASHQVGTGAFAGAFLKDSAGTVHIGHTGRLHRIPATNFIATYPGPKPPSAAIEDGRSKQFLLLGALDDGNLVALLRDFAWFVRAFKEQSVRQTRIPGFLPEFVGTARVSARKAYYAEYVHGRVVGALAQQVRAAGARVTNTQQIDLIAWNSRNEPIAIYEVKSTSQPYDVYTALGQLQLHSRQLRAGARRVMVLPEAPHGDVTHALVELGISVAVYRLVDGRPVFREQELKLR